MIVIGSWSGIAGQCALSFFDQVEKSFWKRVFFSKLFSDVERVQEHPLPLRRLLRTALLDLPGGMALALPVSGRRHVPPAARGPRWRSLATDPSHAAFRRPRQILPGLPAADGEKHRLRPHDLQLWGVLLLAVLATPVRPHQPPGPLR